MPFRQWKEANSGNERKSLGHRLAGGSEAKMQRGAERKRNVASEPVTEDRRCCAVGTPERADRCAVRHGAARAGRSRHQRPVGSGAWDRIVSKSFHKRPSSRFSDLSVTRLQDLSNVRQGISLPLHWYGSAL